MKTIREILHSKRSATEEHIRRLEQEGKQGVRYTSIMPDIPFLVLGLLCDVGWLIHLIAGVIYYCYNGFHYVLDWVALVAMIAVVLGVGFTIYMNKIHEKEIATKLQKDLSFGLTVYAGLAGAVVGLAQIITYAEVFSTLIWITAGGLINFVAGLPIYLSFRKGVIYGVR